MNKQTMRESYLKMGKNFMTPEIVDWQIKDKSLIELSKGHGLNGDRIYGVSIFEWVDGKWNTTKGGKMFNHDEHKEAQKFYNELTK